MGSQVHRKLPVLQRWMVDLQSANYAGRLKLRRSQMLYGTMRRGLREAGKSMRRPDCHAAHTSADNEEHQYRKTHNQATAVPTAN